MCIDTPLGLQDMLFVLHGYNATMWLWHVRTKLYTHMAKNLYSIISVLNPGT